jgi:hypothetical protein
MARFSNAQLTETANSLSRLPAAAHPLFNPQAMQQYNPTDRALVSAVAKSPAHAQIALKNLPMGGATTAAGAATAASGTTPLASHALTRSPTTRHNIVGFGAATIPANSLTGVAAVPYAPAFKATRMVISAVTLAPAGAGPGTIGNWKVGSKSQFAAVGQEPQGLFAAGLNGGRLRFSRAIASMSISAQVTMFATQAFYACLIGTSVGRKDNKRPPAQYAKEDRVYIPSTTVAPGASATVNVAPTRKFWPTKLVLDDTLTGTFGLNPGLGASSFILNDLLVGSDSQFMSAPPVSGAPTPVVPAGVFNGLWSPNIDFDRIDTQVPLTFELTNVGSQTATFQGVVLGDVDKRADVESDDGEDELY